MQAPVSDVICLQAYYDQHVISLPAGAGIRYSIVQN